MSTCEEISEKGHGKNEARLFAEQLIDFFGDVPVPFVEVVARAGFVREPPVDGHDRLAGGRLVGKRLLLVREPEQFPVSFTA